MQQRSIGGVHVSEIGLGAMPLSVAGRPGRQQAIDTIHAALEVGITLVDTADAYSLGADDFGHNEELVAEALHNHPLGVDVLVATKGGHTRAADGSWELDGRPEHLVAACEASLRRLGVEAIGLYQLHRPDPKVPFAESVGALAELLDAGKIRLAGVSNVDPDQIREADAVLGGRLAAVQNEFSPRFRHSEPELRLCAELGIAFLPWSPLGGMNGAGELGRRHRAFTEVARRHRVSPQRVCLAWMLAKAPVVVPIPGSTRPETILDSAAAAELRLTPEEIATLDAST
ncbi:putative oxidoreductase [Streptoalloteichus tenebrarius]|uniref:Oxidoreductase n=2 Tax=Streptoalloteichus tenebrarius (strain ATCC 17920 / DSM 40477 / JCM 4838 / CBS 697.72 / NBRC 16177 / NCIMB 11028 / NRRL B-12390 / A12253. 1 / ISP 5477) TaxID=1933 RepID=A0ABT1HT21_STRSD|nr:putative oxidoreductase [Streptoalloteichus tenebrarius]